MASQRQDICWLGLTAVPMFGAFVGSCGKKWPKPVKPSKSVIQPIKPKLGIIEPIKTMSPQQTMKKSLADNKKTIKSKGRKTKAIHRVRMAQNKSADINQQSCLWLLA
jgi:hypothetical protein